MMRRIRALRIGTNRTVAALTTALVLAGAFAGYASFTHHQAQQRDRAAHACLTAVTPASQAIFSYDYRNFDASVANGQSFVTGDFAKEYTTTTTGLKATAVKEQAVVQAQVSAVGIVSTAGGSVDVLVYLNQYRRNANITGEKVDQDRVLLTMLPVGKDCKVSKASAI
jgi:Mce-associated membrane protein